MTELLNSIILILLLSLIIYLIYNFSNSEPIVITKKEYVDDDPYYGHWGLGWWDSPWAERYYWRGGSRRYRYGSRYGSRYGRRYGRWWW